MKIKTTDFTEMVDLSFLCDFLNKMGCYAITGFANRNLFKTQPALLFANDVFYVRQVGIVVCCNASAEFFPIRFTSAIVYHFNVI